MCLLHVTFMRFGEFVMTAPMTPEVIRGAGAGRLR